MKFNIGNTKISEQISKLVDRDVCKVSVFNNFSIKSKYQQI